MARSSLEKMINAATYVGKRKQKKKKKCGTVTQRAEASDATHATSCLLFTVIKNLICDALSHLCFDIKS